MNNDKHRVKWIRNKIDEIMGLDVDEREAFILASLDYEEMKCQKPTQH